MISEKKVSQGTRFFTMVYACAKSVNKAFSTSQSFKLPLCRLVVFIDMNTTSIYLQKEAGVSKYY